MQRVLSKIKLSLGDITKLNVGAIVNAANRSLLGGGGVDGAIHRAAGPRLLEECKTLGGCEVGQAKITKGYNLPTKYVIHTVGPIYRGGHSGEPILLAACYQNSLRLATQYQIKTIAFPSISTGAYGYPIEEASKIATKEVVDFLKIEDSVEAVIFCLFSQHDFELYEKQIKEIEKTSMH